VGILGRRRCSFPSLVLAFALVLTVPGFAGTLAGARTQSAKAVHSSGLGATRLVDESPGEDDWWLPGWVQPSPNSGFFSEETDSRLHVDLRVVDLTWRQLAPTATTFADDVPGDEFYGGAFAPLAEQLADPGDFWLRLWISDVEAAPTWLAEACPGLRPVGQPGYMNDLNYPIWDPCVWSHAREVFRTLLLDRGLRADPRLRFVYVPGAFTYGEFDFDIITAAHDAGDLTFDAFNSWFRGAIHDLVDIMNGDNTDPDDDFAWKLVFTGEDFPYGPQDEGWHTEDDLLARDAVAAGMGIRTGITETFNLHLAQVPAYGTTIAPDGHLVTDEGWVLFDGKRVAATENECYTTCGSSTEALYYAIKMSNLKALQLRMNWIYVVPDDSYLRDYPDFWEYVRLSLGKSVDDSPDAWVALREAEDKYWEDDPILLWDGFPYVKNLERWLVQRDVAPDGLSRRGSEVRRGEPLAENGTAYEGRSTDHGAGSDYLYFDVDDRFLCGAAGPVLLKITYRDEGGAIWSVEYTTSTGVGRTAPVANAGSGAWKTVTFAIGDARFDDSFRESTDFRIDAGGEQDLEVRFVRLIKAEPPRH
jgi:hypothetical protein